MALKELREKILSLTKRVIKQNIEVYVMIDNLHVSYRFDR